MRSTPFDSSVHTPERLAETFYGLEIDLRSYAEVAKALGIRIPRGGAKVLENRIGRAIRKLEKNGFIRHSILSGETDYPQLLPDLEDRLRQRYRLRDVVVVDVTVLEKRTDLTEEQQDDEKHRRLGKWGGRILASQIRPTDVVGVGSGRGAAYCEQYCLVPRGSHRPRSVVSLTGSMGIIGPWSMGAAQRPEVFHTDAIGLDSDIIISRLGVKLSPTDGTKAVSAQIANKQGDPQAEKRLVQNQSDTTLAMVGLGALGGGHRLMQWDPETIADELSEAREDVLRLRSVIQKATQIATPRLGRHWVGDISNHLFLVGEEHPNKEVHAELERAIDAVNARFLSTAPSVFEKIADKGVVIAVAGGRHKAAAIHYVLSAGARENRPLVTHLVTDSTVAREVLSREAAIHPSQG